MLPNIVVVTIVAVINAYKSLRRRYYITSAAIPPVKYSAWVNLFNSKDDQSFVCLTGFNYDAFMALHSILFDGFHRKKTGRQENLNSFAKLGCVLLYLNSTLQPKHLCLLFGASPSTISRTITFMINLIVKKLQHHPDSAILWPTESEKGDYARLISSREPLIKNGIGFIDGLALRICCSSEINEQNAYYNGWHGDTYVNNVIVFSPKGKVIYAAINYFGSWHDAKVCRHLYQDILSKETNYAIIADSAFPKNKHFKHCVLKPIKKFSMDPVKREEQKALSFAITSLRQAAEWGMRSIQATFARLKLRLTSDKVQRYNIILSCLLLHNYRTQLMGINQISEVFSKEYQCYVNDASYDRIARYFNVENVN